MRRLLPLSVSAVVLALAVTGCGEGTGTSTGSVSTLDGPVCLLLSTEVAECFSASPEQREGLVVGDCLTIDWESAGSSAIPRVVSIAEAQDCTALPG